MATTFELIASQTLASNTASVTFSSIPATYDDLVLTFSIRSSRSDPNDVAYVKFNGSNGTQRQIRGAGSGGAYSETNGSMQVGWLNGATSTSNSFSSGEAYIPNYTGSTNKSMSSTLAQELNGTVAMIVAGASLWSSTAAITSISMHLNTGPNFVTGSSFYLYGVTHA